jgi:His-Xaa-Ser system protein HxsD
MNIDLTFDNRVNSIEAVQKALYRVISNSDFDFDLKIDGLNIQVTLTTQDSSVDIQLLATELKRCVNDYSLREKIGAETADLRNLILATAFSRIIEQNNQDDELIQ